MRALRPASALAILAALACATAPAARAGICTSCPGPVDFDFNGDGRADLIRSSASLIRVDLLEGTVVVGSGFFPTGGGVFALKAVGRLDADANADFVAQGGGYARVTFVDAAGTGTKRTLYIADGGGAWQVVGTADLDGDGIDELLFEGTGPATGSLRIANLASGSPVFRYLATGGGAWTYALAADLNGDGQQDLLFRGDDSTGNVARVNRSGGTANVKYIEQGGGAWQPKLAGDFDGDGIEDLVDVAAAPATGHDRIRLFDANGNPASAGYVQTGGGSFALRATGDFDGDHKADLGYDGPASFRILAMDGVAPRASYFPSNDGGAFFLRRMSDTNADGLADLVVFDAAGDVRIQLSALSGTVPSAREQFALLPALAPR